MEQEIYEVTLRNINASLTMRVSIPVLCGLVLLGIAISGKY